MLKSSVEFLLAHGGPATLAARRRRGATLILAYHNVVPDEAPPIGDRSLHLSLTQFRAQLDLLTRTHDIVGLGSIMAESSDASRPRAVITFDDAYRGAVTLAMPELARRGLPATLFVAPGLLGSEGCWWDALAASDGRGLLPAVRSHVLEALRGDGQAAVDWARAAGAPIAPLPAHAGIATEQELHAAAALPGIQFGAHTWTHRNLARLSDREHDKEFVEPLAWLRARFPRVLPWVAYPYGLSSPATALRARAAGYQGALLIEGGWMSPSASASFELPRINVPAGLSTSGFILRISGLISS